MKKFYFVFLLLHFFYTACAQDADYIKKHAVVINDPDKLNDDIYKLLSPFQLILVGEMHGTNESPQFVDALASLFTSQGDSVCVGLEIPESEMKAFLEQRTESSVYASDFFLHPAFESGRESVPMAQLIAKLNNNPLVNIFFYDINNKDLQHRDSLMAANIKQQVMQHQHYRVITLSGNFHAKITMNNAMASFIISDEKFKAKTCSLNIQYSSGSANADFGNGLMKRELGGPESAFDTAVKADHYLLLLPAGDTSYEWNGCYYTRTITAAEMTKHEKFH